MRIFLIIALFAVCGCNDIVYTPPTVETASREHGSAISIEVIFNNHNDRRKFTNKHKTFSITLNSTEEVEAFKKQVYALSNKLTEARGKINE